MPQPLAKWNPARDVWETEQMDLFSAHSDVYSETWPRSGSMRNGVAYAHPTWGHHMDEPAFSSSPRAGLLPSPRASDTNGPGLHGTGGMDLRTAVSLLPTPRATDGTKGGPNQRGSSGDMMMPSAVHSPEWGTYAPAIERWAQVLGREAPPPTEPTGRGGKHRLSPAFVEFMMGLPAGWVTDVPITRNEQLKALGNGVVPQQCTAALRDMLAATTREAAA